MQSQHEALDMDLALACNLSCRAATQHSNLTGCVSDRTNTRD